MPCCQGCDLGRGCDQPGRGGWREVAEGFDAFADTVIGVPYEWATGVESAVTGWLCDQLPPWMRNAMEATQRDPWRQVAAAGSATVVQYSPLMLMPFSFPLALVQVPLQLWVQGSRFSFNVMMNCGNVTTTARNEACDITSVIDLLSTRTTSGRLMRNVLKLAGQDDGLVAYDKWAEMIRPVLSPVCQGDLPTLSNAIAFGEAIYNALTDDDADFSAFEAQAEKSEAELAQIELDIMLAMAELDALSVEAEPMYSASKEVVSDLAQEATRGGRYQRGGTLSLPPAYSPPVVVAESSNTVLIVAAIAAAAAGTYAVTR